MTHRICAAPGCDKLCGGRKYGGGRGYCRAHYSRLWTGRPLDTPLRPHNPGSRCTVDGCEAVHMARGLCSKHWQRLRNTGSLDLPAKPTVCSVDGCTTTPRRRDLCDRHASRIDRHGDPAIVLGGPEGIEDRHHNWTGHDATYRAVHKRLDRRRGKATEHACVDCGAPAAHWSYNHDSDQERSTSDGLPYSPDPEAYSPRCASCHARLDHPRDTPGEGTRVAQSRSL